MCCSAGHCVVCFSAFSKTDQAWLIELHIVTHIVCVSSFIPYFLSINVSFFPLHYFKVLNFSGMQPGMPRTGDALLIRPGHSSSATHVLFNLPSPVWLATWEKIDAGKGRFKAVAGLL